MENKTSKETINASVDITQGECKICGKQVRCIFGSHLHYYHGIKAPTPKEFEQYYVFGVKA